MNLARKDGKIYLIDEINTPDSSRYFYADEYQERFDNGLPQKQLSKEFVREWLMANGFQGMKGQKVPEMTDEFVNEISERYIELYEKITGEKFIKTDISDIAGRIETNCRRFLATFISVIMINLLTGFRKLLASVIIIAAFTVNAGAQVVVEKSKDKVIISGVPYYIHVVKKGETAYSIAKAYEITR